MKKLNKVLAILCTSAIAVSGVAAFTACGGDGGHDHNAHLTYVSDGATAPRRVFGRRLQD